MIFKNAAEAIKGFGEIVKGLIMILMEMADKGGEAGGGFHAEAEARPCRTLRPRSAQALQALAMARRCPEYRHRLDRRIAVGWIAKIRPTRMADIDAQSTGIKDFFALHHRA